MMYVDSCCFCMAVSVETTCTANPLAEALRKGCDYVDISLVDGWTLPVKLDIQGDCNLPELIWDLAAAR